MDYTVYMAVISVLSSTLCFIASLILGRRNEKEDKATLDYQEDAKKGNVVQ